MFYSKYRWANEIVARANAQVAKLCESARDEVEVEVEVLHHASQGSENASKSTPTTACFEFDLWNWLRDRDPAREWTLKLHQLCVGFPSSTDLAKVSKYSFVVGGQVIFTVSGKAVLAREVVAQEAFVDEADDRFYLPIAWPLCNLQNPWWHIDFIWQRMLFVVEVERELVDTVKDVNFRCAFSWGDAVPDVHVDHDAVPDVPVDHETLMKQLQQLTAVNVLNNSNISLTTLNLPVSGWCLYDVAALARTGAMCAALRMVKPQPVVSGSQDQAQAQAQADNQVREEKTSTFWLPARLYCGALLPYLGRDASSVVLAYLDTCFWEKEIQGSCAKNASSALWDKRKVHLRRQLSMFMIDAGLPSWSDLVVEYAVPDAFAALRHTFVNVLYFDPTLQNPFELNLPPGRTINLSTATEAEMTVQFASAASFDLEVAYPNFNVLHLRSGSLALSFSH